MEVKIKQKAAKYFTDEEKHVVIREFLSTNCTKQAIWEKYTGHLNEHGHLRRWMILLGYQLEDSHRNRTLQANYYMTKKENKVEFVPDSFENLQLKNRIKELEKQLKEAELKAIAFSTMVDIAEKEFKIPIRKKFNTKL